MRQEARNECMGMNGKGQPCQIAPLPGALWCLEHLFGPALGDAAAAQLKARIETLIQVVDGRIRGASIQQQLGALNLLGHYGGLADEPPPRRMGRR
jgi:hypothetical protein